jgi:ubiquitin carboxyl-terminal hydrolase 8
MFLTNFNTQLLRSTHGIVCEDNKTVSFQAHDYMMTTLIQHHDASGQKNGHSKPVEFPRYVLPEPMPQVRQPNPSVDNDYKLVPVVEVYPVKLRYVITDDGDTTRSGFILVSKNALVLHALREAMNVIVPDKASSCVRIWSLRDDKATQEGDGYELVDLNHLDGRLLSARDPEISKLIIGDWVFQHGGSTDLIVETRRKESLPWKRSSLELSNRICVGDFVDAQDSMGNWFESLVREISEDTIRVHYIGWASKWDANLRRTNDGTVEGVNKFCLAPVPLWTHTSRWRKTLKAGDSVEVRDTSSRHEQPKWFAGLVRKLGKQGDPIKELYNSSILEHFEVVQSTNPDSGRILAKPLLLLKNIQQVLVEVAQEKINKSGNFLEQKPHADDENPPYIRWVYLYGEEICAFGTHIKVAKGESKPATVVYDFDPRKPPVEVLKSHLYGSGFVRESLRGQPPAPGSVGLQNLGNSCFMNSIIQCLNQCEPISTYFLSDKYGSDLNRKNPLGSGGRVAMAYASLLADIWGGQYSVLAPRLLKQTIASFAPQFNNVHQHDSHEFCSFLMDGLHEDCNRVVSKPYVEEYEGLGIPDNKNALESWRRHLLRHDSIIVDHCQGMHRSHLTCPICGKESIKFDVFSSLSVPLPFNKGQSSIPLDDCLEKFTEGEQLDENNSWYCPKCLKHVCALKMLALWTIPDILIIHLKRFQYENRDGGVFRSKLEDRVVFPTQNLDMTKYVLGPIDSSSPPIYDLFGVSEHSGITANSGHYTATVKNCKDGKWYRFNDSHVGISSGDAAITGGAYLLFYQRAKGKCKWAGMEKIMLEGSIDPHGALHTDVDGFQSVKTKRRGKKG